MHPLRHIRRCAALLLLPLVAGTAAAQEPDTLRHAMPVPGEVRALPDAPVLLLVAAGGAGAMLLDGTVRDHLAAGPDTEQNPAARAGNVLGRGRLIVLGLGGVYGTARAVGNEPLADGAARIFAGVAAAGVVNGSLKFGVGRLRPSAGEGPLRFRPFNLENRWQSFPAGHALAAFALASAVSEEVRSPWVSVPAFSAATLVGWSRIYDDKHWVSDVLGGAVIGTVVSRGTVRWLRGRGPAVRTAPFALVLLPDGAALHLPLP